ncbi:MAG: electron transport complex subunit D [Lysobacteraceae bacterium]|nr:MAG: electron transport complex subunit D [Xanthomonadaceae bacterium]
MIRRFEVQPVPVLHGAPPVRRIMGEVLLALLPAVAVQAFFHGIGIFIQIALACAFALAFEALGLRLRGQPQRPFLHDLSAPLTAVLFALCVPPDTPWWASLTAMAAGILVAKQAYGGLGANLFNPAMVGYAVVLVCFPAELARWPVPGQADPATTLAAVFGLGPAIDAVAGPTPLDAFRHGLPLPPGPQPAPALAAAFLAGGILLLARGIIHLRQPAAMLLGCVLLALPGWLADPQHAASPWFHLLHGGTLLAAFFVVTDPVTGCASPRGQWLFGLGVGALTVLIRQFGHYPDGIAFAVLLMNCAAPLIDLHLRPRRSAPE